MEITIKQLKQLQAEGKFHHATYRQIGTLLEGLYVYEKEENGYNGFKQAGVIYKDDASFNEAHKLVNCVHVGAYRKG